MSFQELSTRERGGKDSLIAVDSIKVRCLDYVVQSSCIELFTVLYCTINLL